MRTLPRVGPDPGAVLEEDRPMSSCSPLDLQSPVRSGWRHWMPEPGLPGLAAVGNCWA